MLKDIHVMDKYLQQAIDNLERQSTKKIMSVIVDYAGSVLATTTAGANSVGVGAAELIGVSASQISDEQINWLMPGITGDKELKQIKANYTLLVKLIQIVFKEEIALSYIDFMPYAGNKIPYLNTMIPIFGEQMNVVGIQSTTTEYSLYGHNEYFQELANLVAQADKPKIQDNAQQTQYLKLAPRQHEIVYLLANGFSQSETAQILDIGRGTVAKIVSEQICPKFNIAGSCSKILIEKAILAGFHTNMPQGLFKPFIIILNHEIVEKYF